jgi:hypothetical protein
MRPVDWSKRRTAVVAEHEVEWELSEVNQLRAMIIAGSRQANHRRSAARSVNPLSVTVWDLALSP